MIPNVAAKARAALRGELTPPQAQMVQRYLRRTLIEQEFRPEPPSKQLLFARWLVQHNKISG